MKSSLKFLFSFEKFFAMAIFCFATVFSAKTQTIVVQPSVDVVANQNATISMWIWGTAGTQINSQLNYFTSGGDTLTLPQNLNSMNGLNPVEIEFGLSIVQVSCGVEWFAFVNVWIDGQDTIQSNDVQSIFECPQPVTLEIQSEEIVGLGLVVSFNYNSGGVNAFFTRLTSIDGQTAYMQTESILGVGTFTDTLELSAGQTYEICNVFISNGSYSDFLFYEDCLSGEMDSFVSSVPEASLTSEIIDGTLSTDFTVVNSGDVNSEFSVTVEKMLCDSSFGLYEEFNFLFTEIILDSIFSISPLQDLPAAPAWRVTLNASNDSFEMTSISTVLDVALNANPTVSLELTALGNGYYEAETAWDDDSAGNVILSYYVNDVFVGQLVPTQSPAMFEIPVEIGPYSDAVVEVLLESNTCSVSTSMETISSCQNPTHILEMATDITTNSANVQLLNVNFSECVEEAMVGVILVGVDTVWYPLSVNTEEISSYLIQLTNLESGMTYVYLGVLFAGDEYFTTNFSLSFTTEVCPNPTHILETATNITTTSANVQLAYVNFGECVEEAMVGIILVGVDTIWSPLSVNTEESTNYIVQLTNLTPNQTYVYLGVLYAEGEYFTTNFSLSFTTLSDEPVPPTFTNWSVNWDMSMLITMFLHYNLGDMSSTGLRVFHDGPNNPVVEILDVLVSNEFTSLDYNLQGQYGTHICWAELYNPANGEVYETVDPSIWTFQQPIGIQEIGRTVERFDRIEVYNLSGQLMGNYRNGEILDPNFSQGVYLFVGWNKNQPTSSKIKI